jgi:beta-phosphoglucomutase
MIPEEIFPGVKPLLVGLRERGIKVGLASSSKNAQTVIQVLHIQHEFDAVVDGTMITHSKPDPEIFLLAARRLGVAPADCLVFEDAEAGVEAALAAGMKCIGIGAEDQLGKADRVFKTTNQFTVEMVKEF